MHITMKNITTTTTTTTISTKRAALVGLCFLFSAQAYGAAQRTVAYAGAGLVVAYSAISLFKYVKGLHQHVDLLEHRLAYITRQRNELLTAEVDRMTTCLVYTDDGYYVSEVHLDATTTVEGIRKTISEEEKIDEDDLYLSVSSQPVGSQQLLSGDKRALKGVMKEASSTTITLHKNPSRVMKVEANLLRAQQAHDRFTASQGVLETPDTGFLYATERQVASARRAQSVETVVAALTSSGKSAV